jgi:[ribosomal protein S18]-alanine N-acetyltransferase
LTARSFPPVHTVIFKLRDYAPGDFETLYEIDQQCYVREIAYSRPDLHGYLHLPGGDCVVAEENGNIAGFLITAREDGLGYIVTIDVLDAYRRQGVATLMLEESERRLAAGGVRRVELETATDNRSAIALWQKHGYRTDGVKKRYYPDGRDAFSMSKRLQ